MTDTLIQPELKRREFIGEKINSLSNMKDHITARTDVFFNTLDAVNQGIVGWERVAKIDGELIKTVGDREDQKALFTGSGLCDVASFAITDAVNFLSDTIHAEPVVFQTDMKAELWNDPRHKPFNQSHAFVRLTDTKTGEVLYIDATYAQVNHKTLGSIQFIKEETLDTMYYEQHDASITPVPIDNTSRMEMFKKAQSNWGLQQQDLEELTQTLIRI